MSPVPGSTGAVIVLVGDMTTMTTMISITVVTVMATRVEVGIGIGIGSAVGMRTTVIERGVGAGGERVGVGVGGERVDVEGG